MPKKAMRTKQPPTRRQPAATEAIKLPRIVAGARFCALGGAAVDLTTALPSPLAVVEVAVTPVVCVLSELVVPEALTIFGCAPSGPVCVMFVTFAIGGARSRLARVSDNVASCRVA